YPCASPLRQTRSAAPPLLAAPLHFPRAQAAEPTHIGASRFPDFGPGSPHAPGDYSMATRMLIDARHPEETRVAVLKGNRIEEFDFESAEHKQIKGNIYLAKVTRVEPS